MADYGITVKEKDAIRFYQGDVRKRDDSGALSNMDEEGFYGINSAYKTMNCLMFPGIENEKERIREKNARLIPQILEEADKTLEVFCDIYRAMCKYACAQKRGIKRKVYRTERGVSLTELKKGRLSSFTSTSLVNEPEKFLKEKSGLTLLELVVPCTVPQVDFQEILGDEYLYPKQKEVLLPPFLEITLQELEMTEEEKTWRDVDGKMPQGKYLILVDEIQKKGVGPCSGGQWGEVLTYERNKEAAQLLEQIIQTGTLSEQEMERYCSWKADFQNAVKTEFAKIREEFWTEPEQEKKRRDELQQEVRKLLFFFKKSRKEYKQKLMTYHLILAAVSVLPIFFMALSFLNHCETVMKVAAIVTSTAAIILTRIIKVEALGVKMLQYTKTYLILCDLNRELKYETDQSKSKTDEYVQRLRKIMQEDTEMSLQNLKIQIESGETFFQDEIDV